MGEDILLSLLEVDKRVLYAAAVSDELVTSPFCALAIGRRVR